jgi:superfamily II DNA/RNA helicase
MKKKEIVDNIRQRLAIDSLNPMQQTMAASDAANILLLAPTGSGKTIAFALAMLRRVEAAVPGIKAVVLAPSRELVLQVASVLRPIATGMKTVALYGGHNMRDEVNSLSIVPDIVVATPGRLVDHINRSTIDISGARTLVLDEYDKSLQLGFLDEMTRIVKRMRHRCATILTSATTLDDLPPIVGRLSDFTLINYSDIASPRANTDVVEVASAIPDKLDTLVDLLRSLDNTKVIIFVNHRESAQRVYDRLHRDRFPVGLYHGGLEQQERRLAIEMLNNGSTPILVSTDLASRGLDIDSVGAVVHYHLPLTEAEWTHRNGRTARQGASGEVYAITREGENVPDFIAFDRSLSPTRISANPISRTVATLYINAGKKEKISRGDILGYLVKAGGLTPDQVGTITVDDHWSIVAVPASVASATIKTLATTKLKNRRVRVSLLSR